MADHSGGSHGSRHLPIEVSGQPRASFNQRRQVALDDTPDKLVVEPAPIAADGSQLLEPDDAKPASTRGRRGWRRKEEPEQPPAGGEAHPEETGTTAGADAADSEHPAAPEAPEEAGTTPGNDSTTDRGDALSALPDDLFSDPLI